MTANFTPCLFIDIGKDHHFFTLRETYLHVRHVPGEGPMGNAVVNGVYQGTIETEVRSFHHFNLSTDPYEAWGKAMATAECMGLRLDGSLEELATALDAIRRATKEELEAREAAYKAQREAWALEREQERLAVLEDLLQGRISFGAKKGQTFDAQDPDYLQWVVDRMQDFEPGSFMHAMAQAIKDKFAHLLPAAWSDKSWDTGRHTWEVLVRRVHKKVRPCYGREWMSETVYMVCMQDVATGACLMTSGANFRATRGERLRIKATVKNADSYNGIAQTWVNRVTVLEEVPA